MNTTASTIGEFIRYNSCERRFKLTTDNQISETIPFWNRLNNPLNIVLAQTGKDKEKSWEQALRKGGLIEIKTDQNNHGKATTSWNGFLAGLTSIPLGQSAYAREVEIKGRIGLFDINGQIDFLLLLWLDGQPVGCNSKCRYAAIA
ncbi:hypothetical protein [Spirosoma spitsbergense]|uniref:hypothetical protein n=1 Tax=Spirosoma spitsbergense TaxID=431554 RepID=UPI0003820520|nr:hypothetical protein [Spirosoma spitsbergense]